MSIRDLGIIEIAIFLVLLAAFLVFFIFFVIMRHRQRRYGREGFSKRQSEMEMALERKLEGAQAIQDRKQRGQGEQQKVMSERMDRSSVRRVSSERQQEDFERVRPQEKADRGIEPENRRISHVRSEKRQQEDFEGVRPQEKAGRGIEPENRRISHIRAEKRQQEDFEGVRPQEKTGRGIEPENRRISHVRSSERQQEDFEGVRPQEKADRGYRPEIRRQYSMEAGADWEAFEGTGEWTSEVYKVEGGQPGRNENPRQPQEETIRMWDTNSKSVRTVKRRRQDEPIFVEERRISHRRDQLKKMEEAKLR